MMVISHIVESYEEQITDEFADVIVMNWLGGDNFCNIKDLGICYLLNFFSWDEEGIN